MGNRAGPRWAPQSRAWLLAFLAAATLAAGLSGSGRSGATPTQALPTGEWTTFANGDDILALALDGATLWAGTRSGGLVRWDTASGDYEQFLRPQRPLGGNTVRDIAIGPDGRKWLATNGGVSVLDDAGTAAPGDDRWHTFTASNSGLPSDDVRAVAIEGAFVWVGTAQVWDVAAAAWSGGGVARLDTAGTPEVDDDSVSAAYTFASTYKRLPDGTEHFGLVSDNVNDIAVTAEGGLWIATSPHWQLQKGADPEAPMAWARVHGGVTYVDTAGTPALTDDLWKGTSCHAMQVTLTCQVEALAIDAQGWVWAAIHGRGVMYFRSDEADIVDDQSRRIDIPGRLPGETVDALALGPADVPELANTVWLARSRGGLSVLDHKGSLRDRKDDVWNFGLSDEAFTRADGLPRDRVQALVVVRDTAWVGTGAAYGVAGGIGPLAIRDLTFGPAWTTRRAPPTNFITDLDFGQPDTRWAGHVWIGTGSRAQQRFGAGVVDLDTRDTPGLTDDTWTVHTTLGTDPDGQSPWAGLGGQNVHAVLVQGDRVWLGSIESIWDADLKKYKDGGLSVFDGTAWTARTPENTGAPDKGLHDASVVSLAEDCDGAIWIGTGSPWESTGAGVDVLTPGASVHQRTQDTWRSLRYTTLASDNTSDIAIDCERRLAWVASAHHVAEPGDFGSPGGRLIGGGVARQDMAAGTWAKYDSRNGFISYAADILRGEALSVVPGPEGRAWVGTFGTDKTSTAELVNQKPFWPAVVNFWDGQAWTHQVLPRAGMAGSLARDAAGRLWVATTRGGLARDDALPEGWKEDQGVGGLFVYAGGDLTSAPTVLRPDTSGVPANDISVVKVAPNGDVWIGTEGWGLARYREQGEAPTPTATSPRGASPTPTQATPGPGTPSPTATGGGEVTPTRGTPTGATPTRGTPATPGAPALYLPFAQQRRNGATLPSATATRPVGGTPSATPPGATPSATRALVSATPDPNRTPEPSRTPGPSPTRTAFPSPSQPPEGWEAVYLPFNAQRRPRR